MSRGSSRGGLRPRSPRPRREGRRSDPRPVPAMAPPGDGGRRRPLCEEASARGCGVRSPGRSA
eukprot:220104-Alexandrium_andersonii.AAC.1